MDNTFWDTLIGYGTKVRMDKDVMIGGQSVEEQFHNVYLLEEGICALTGFTKQGEEKIYLYFHPRRIICFNQMLISPMRRAMRGPEFSIFTKTPCILYQISYETFHGLLARDRKFNEFLIETLADNYSEALVHFHLMQEESAAARLCRLLLEISVETSRGRIVPKFFTYAELAKYLGTHPVTVSRIMTKLKHCGFISRTADGLVIRQEAALTQLINSESCFKY